jgi:predicted HicB family RNase H-like nuclease
MQKMSKGKGPRRNFTFRTTDSQYRLIKRLADKAGLPMNEWMVQQLTAQVDRNEREMRQVIIEYHTKDGDDG